jgi:DNA-binding Lrp family transcriptional regulator
MTERPSNVLRNDPPSRALDRIDFALLAAVQDDARLSNKELAARVGLAPSSCLERMRRLVQAGVVRGWHADLDPAALGLSLQALIAVELARHTRANLSAFVAHLRTLPEVTRRWSLAGRIDFLLEVACRDAAHLERLTVDGLSSRDEVGRVETWLVFSGERKGLPLPAR